MGAELRDARVSTVGSTHAVRKENTNLKTACVVLVFKHGYSCRSRLRNSISNVGIFPC